ncbi:MAG: type IV secretion system DNA-binding domain-containing protein [Patescibacteria group bacterium]|nr:type IV secretion system DNA-binding domain-containing protein [Patescibacteria group bacterium]
MEEKNPITYFAGIDRRNKRTSFGIKASDRTRHFYVIGKTGMGKSTMLENMAVQDIQSGNGICFIDPHGLSVKKFLDYVPENRIEDVIYFAPFDVNNPISFNVMEDVGPDKRHLVAQGLLSAFKKIWGEDTFSDRMEHITNNTLLALLEYPGSTMLGMTKIFTDAKYRKKVVNNITDPSVKAFWTEEFAGWDDRYRRDAYAAILNKVGQFTSNPLIRNIIGQEKSSFNFRDVIDNKKILLVNLSIGQVGEANADLLGSMLTTKIYLAAMSRADVSQNELAKLPNFYLYIDEFQNLANDSFADILSQARKYKLNLTIAHQYIEQMPEKVHAAVFGNVGTMVAFRVGATDAELLEKEFSPEFLVEDIVNLGFAQIYLKLMIDGISSTPFSARTLPPIKKPTLSFKDEVIEFSRKQFTQPKEQVEKKISEWHNQSNLQSQKKGESPIGEPQKNDKRSFQKNESKNSPSLSLNDLKGRKDYQRINNVTFRKEKKTLENNNGNALKKALSNAIQNFRGEDKEEVKKVFDKKDLKSVPQQKFNQRKYKNEHVNDKTKEIPKDVLEKMLYVKKPDENK